MLTYTDARQWQGDHEIATLQTVSLKNQRDQLRAAFERTPEYQAYSQLKQPGWAIYPCGVDEVGRKLQSLWEIAIQTPAYQAYISAKDAYDATNGWLWKLRNIARYHGAQPSILDAQERGA